MGRKHQRDDQVEALDADALQAEANAAAEQVRRTVRRRETEAERDARIRRTFDRRRARNEKRTDARVSECLRGRWDTCCIPGCLEPVRGSWRPTPTTPDTFRPYKNPDDTDPALKLPLCSRHLVIIQKMASNCWTDPDVEQMREVYARRWVEREVERHRQWDVIDENGGAEQGQIYFVRINGMVKVGWSSKLKPRLKSYGASAEILAHYPATRDEETGLHRQLRPYLAMGREWYQDCQLIADVVAGVVKRHGKPSVLPYWTEPKKDLSARPRGYPAA